MIAYQPQGERHYVTREAYWNAIFALQDAMRELQEERAALKVERDDAKADAATALQYASELWMALATALPIVEAEWTLHNPVYGPYSEYECYKCHGRGDLPELISHVEQCFITIARKLLAEGTDAGR